MHRRIIVAVLAVAAGAVFTIVATSGAQAPGPQTLVLKENQKGGTFAFIDQKPLSKHGRASVGDQLVFSNPLADTAGKPTGKLEVVCTDIKAGPADNGAGYLCQAVAHLNNGDIFVEARFASKRGPAPVTGAVTGGVGAYANARGTFTSDNTDHATDTFVFTTS